MKEKETLREEIRGMNKKMEDLREYVKKEGHRTKVEDLDQRELIESVKEKVMEEMKEEQDQRLRKNVKESGNSDCAERQRQDKKCMRGNIPRGSESGRCTHRTSDETGKSEERGRQAEATTLGEGERGCRKV